MVNLKLPDYPDITTNISKTLATTDDIKSLYKHRISFTLQSKNFYFDIYNAYSTTISISNIADYISGDQIVNSDIFTYSSELYIASQFGSVGPNAYGLKGYKISDGTPISLNVSTITDTTTQIL